MLETADKILAAKPDDKDVVMLAAAAKAEVLDDPHKLSVLEAQLTGSGHKAAARTVHARLLAVEVERAASSGDAAEFGRRLEEVKTFLGERYLEKDDDALAMQVGMSAEAAISAARAAEVCDDLSKLLSADSRFSETAKMLTGAARRLRLVGHPVRLEGKTLDGKKLDWASYRGKVVLVQFWVNSPVCTLDFFFFKDYYKRFRDKGFEIVGIGVDDQMSDQACTDFLKGQEVPWTNCRDADASTPMLQYYGIHTMPVLILVGRDGNVISTTLRLGDVAKEAVKALSATAPIVQETPKKSSAESKAELRKEWEKKKEQERAARLKKAEELKAKAKAVKARTWSDASGGFHVTAKFRGVVNGKVKLEKEDGEIVNVPLEKLSEEDQKYIRQRQH
jgi:alkyl hydroperoxide reductase subunit AhpC/uncharacterized cupin superfamily protein